MTAQLLFFYFGGMTVAGAVVAVASPNLIYSALALLVTFIHIAGIYVLLNAEFIAAVQIIVYAGAILVLYLFVLMLFNPKQEARYLHKQYKVGIFLGFVVLFLMVFAGYKTEILSLNGPVTVEMVRSLGHTRVIGDALFTNYIFPFEIASLILLVAMFGSIILAGRGRRRVKGPAGRVDLSGRKPESEASAGR
ncbi:NADH-quinone oxidoreductase subunit J [Nitrospira defluvii]|nr:NADH-quinone oxidoreductase subunit J [Nitrospira defluvii]